MAINKNFVIKHGVEVNTNLIVGDADTQKVGIGTTVPQYSLHVGGLRGGIGASDAYVSGVTTVKDLHVTGITTFDTGRVLIGAGASTGTRSQLLHVGSATTEGGVYISGDVGLGVTLPGAKLNVVPGSSAIAGLFSGTTEKDMVRITQLGGGNALRIDDIASDASPFVVTGIGSVGIGTTNPEYTLVVDSLVSTGTTALFVHGDAQITGDLIVDDFNLDELTVDQVNVTGILTSAQTKLNGITTAVNINITGIATVGTALSLADDVKAQFGTDGDLIIYGNSTASNIKDTTGDLSLVSNQIYLELSGGTNIVKADQFGIIVSGVTTTQRLYVSGVTTTAGLLDVNGGISITGIDENKVVFGSTNGGLQDSANLTFDGSTLGLTGDQTVSGKISVGTGVTAWANGNLAVAGVGTIQHLVGLAATFNGLVSIADSINHVGNTDTAIRFPTTDVFSVETAGSESFRVDSSQRLLVGNTASRDIFKETRVQISGADGDAAGLSIYSTENGNAGPNLILGHSKNGSKVTDGTILGDITFVGHDNTDLNSRGSIIRSLMTADGTDDSLYADLVLFTKRNAGGYPDETLRLDSSGNLSLGRAAASSTLYGRNFQIHDTGTSGATLHLTTSDTGTTNSDGYHLVQQGAHVYHWLREAGDQVFSTAGTERLRIVDSGAVVTGIATADGFSAGDDEKIRLGDTAGDFDIYFTASDSGQAYVQSGSRPIWIESGAGTVNIRAGAATTLASFTSVAGNIMYKNVVPNVDDSFDLGISGKEWKDLYIDGTANIDTLDVDGTSNFADDVTLVAAGSSTILFDASAWSLIFQDNIRAKFGTGSDLEVHHNGQHSFIDHQQGSGNFFIKSAANIALQANGSTTGINVNAAGDVTLTHAGDIKLATDPAGVIITGIATASGFRAADGVTNGVKIGDGEDLIIQHNGTNSFIDNNTGDLYIQTTGSGDDILIEAADDFQVSANSKTAILAVGDAEVQLYHNNTKKFATSGVGASVYGTGALKIPVGTSLQRPTTGLSPQNGDIRYNTDLNSYEGYGNGTWGGLGGGTEIDVSVSSTSATNITTFLQASYRSASLRVQIVQGSAYQIGRYLLIHDGTTVTVVEEAAIATGSMLGTIDAVINGLDVEVRVTMGSASSATVTTIIDKITV